MAWLVTALLALAASTEPQHTSWTLGQELQKHGVDVRGIEDAGRTITSFAVTSQPDWFAIAYYWYDGTDRLPPELRLRTLDRTDGTWRQTILHAEDRNGGSALRIARRPGVIYLDLHVSPSAGDLLVLSEDLKVRRRLAGWSSLILPDGRVVYENSMVHFAPAHPGSVSFSDPRTNRDVRLYPSKPDEWEGPRWMDRSIQKVEQAGPNQILIFAREQRVLLTRDNRGTPDGPARELLITCDVSAAMPACIVTNKK